MSKLEKTVLTILTMLCLGFIVVTSTGCVAKHPKCAAYDKVEHETWFKTNLDRSLYK